MDGEVHYSLVPCGCTGRYGIMALELDTGRCALACPFSGNLLSALETVRRLNEMQLPIAAFEQVFLQEPRPPE